MALLLFAAVIIAVMAGYPVAFTLGGVALAFALLGTLLGSFEPGLLHAIPSRIFGLITNETLIAVPVFVFMGTVLQKSRLADDLLLAGADLLKRTAGGLGVSVVLIGALLAASTGIVGATVTTMGLLSLPAMLKRGYHPAIACGTICSAGTLGQIVPPSIVLVLLGEVISAAYQQAQLKQGIFAPDTVSVADLFAGALVPGATLVALYCAYLIIAATCKPEWMPAPPRAPQPERRAGGEWARLAKALLPTLSLIFVVLGSIISGAATPTEAASVGAAGALSLAVVKGGFSTGQLIESARATAKITCMVFMILIGATLFSLVFRGFGGDDDVHRLLGGLAGGLVTTMIVVMLLMFVLGFVLDFIEITFVVVPIVGPVLLAMGADPVWLGIMIAVNLQTSFLTPPFGFSLFYLRGVAPRSVETRHIYKGAAPFVGLQLLTLLALALWPQMATWLPSLLLR